MMEDKNEKPLVSIAMPVYNHEFYVAEAIESVLNQKTSFAYELVIGDDHSTDNTLKVLLSYKDKYPDKIKLLLSETNRGASHNASQIYKECSGKYIALLEGDDHWVYELKLQKQIEFLEAHSDYSGCFHDAHIVTSPMEDKTKQNQFHEEYKFYSQFNKYHSDFYPWNVIERNIIPTSSLVVRNSENLITFFETFSDINLSVIWAFQMFVIKDSKFRYINEVWSQYNDHPGGISKTQSLDSFKLSNIEVLKRFAKDIYDVQKYSFYHTIAEEYLQILFNKRGLIKKKSGLYKYILLYLLYSLKSIHYQIKNVLYNRKNIKAN
jgi:glycosyltransferase involved in cell wall biosynthesis